MLSPLGSFFQSVSVKEQEYVVRSGPDPLTHIEQVLDLCLNGLLYFKK